MDTLLRIGSGGVMSLAAPIGSEPARPGDDAGTLAHYSDIYQRRLLLLIALNGCGWSVGRPANGRSSTVDGNGAHADITVADAQISLFLWWTELIRYSTNDEISVWWLSE